MPCDVKLARPLLVVVDPCGTNYTTLGESSTRGCKDGKLARFGSLAWLEEVLGSSDPPDSRVPPEREASSVIKTNLLDRPPLSSPSGNHWVVRITSPPHRTQMVGQDGHKEQRHGVGEYQSYNLENPVSSMGGASSGRGWSYTTRALLQHCVGELHSAHWRSSSGDTANVGRRVGHQLASSPV